MKEAGNIHLAYMVSHSFKHTIWTTEGLNWKTGVNARRDIQQMALSILWLLRKHPYYLAYPNSKKRTIAELLGELPTEERPFEALYDSFRGLSAVESFFFYARMARHVEYRTQGESVQVPESDDKINEGILSDVVIASEGRIKGEALHQSHYQKLLVARAQRAGLSLEETERITIACLNYYLYSIGYVLPWIAKGTQAEEGIEKVNIMLPVLDPRSELKEKFGIEITV